MMALYTSATDFQSSLIAHDVGVTFSLVTPSREPTDLALLKILTLLADRGKPQTWIALLDLFRAL